MERGHNPSDASEIVKRQVDRLVSDPSEEAVIAMDRLAADADLSSYRDHLRHAQAGQIRVRSEERHARPSLAEVVTVLRSGAPANAADLFAYVLDHLGAIKRDLRRTGTDRYKVFWNEDRYARTTDPKVEESGRDRLVHMLNARIEVHGLVAEPEGHMATTIAATSGSPGRPACCRSRSRGTTTPRSGPRSMDSSIGSMPPTCGPRASECTWCSGTGSRPARLPPCPVAAPALRAPPIRRRC